MRRPGFWLEENRLDNLALTREYFVRTPDGRMSVRMPEFVGQREQLRRMRLVLRALNGYGAPPVEGDGG